MIAGTQEASGAERVFSECKRRGVTLFLEDGKIAYKPKARMTKGLLYNIKQSKEGIAFALEGKVEPKSPSSDQGNTLARLIEETPGQLALHPNLTSGEGELHDLLIAISEAGLTLRVPAGDGIKLYVSPPEKVTPELAERIRRHRDKIISAMQFDEYRRTETLQNTRQVLDLWREWETERRNSDNTSRNQ